VPLGVVAVVGPVWKLGTRVDRHRSQPGGHGGAIDRSQDSRPADGRRGRREVAL